MTPLKAICVALLAGSVWCNAFAQDQGGSEMPASPAIEGVFSVKDFGAAGDGAKDDTSAIQSAIDTAAETGGRVYLPPGRYLVSGSIVVKPGVAVVGAAVAPLYIKPLIGSVILATGGRDDEDAPPLFDLGDSSAVQGITVYYPEQKPDDIRVYPWTFRMQGGDNTVENVTLINAYNAIRTGPGANVRHRIRSVYGCALRRGIFVDACTDIGRVENVQLHCHWWSQPEVGGNWDLVFEYMWRNLEAFVFGRTDWEYVTNCFVFPTNVGYRF
ncbi:MAG: glycosyl hydrolase family 28-related protein, partial [Armatimonadota bacterium]